MNSSLTLYVTSSGVDHGPLSLEETAKKIGSGEFKPDDLSWHQGVSGWVPLKQLPEWSQINKTPLPSLTPEKDNIVDGSVLNNTTKHANPAKITHKGNPAKSVISSSQSFEESKDGKTGMGIVGKLMVLVAILVFLSTLGVVGFLVYKNLDRFLPPTAVEEIQQDSVKPSESEQEKKSTVIIEPDPFAAPQDN